MKNELMRIYCLLLLLLATVAIAARAELTIEITTEGGKQIPIAIVPFSDESAMPQGISKLVAADLLRTGLFKLVDTSGVNPLPREPSDINYGDWKAKGVDNVAIGSVATQADGRFDIRFRLLDSVKETQLVALSYTIQPGQSRATAHKIADVIYQTLTGDRGIFSTKIAYVLKGQRYQLKVADADGFNEQTVLTSSEPVMSPVWSPDGTRLAYVSFEPKKPVVVVHTLATGARKIVANFKGSNSAPAWSPDGKKLAVTLTKDAGSQLYLIDAEGDPSASGRSAKRLASSSGIDTEPTFSPDGKWIAFTSDRGGSPQIYKIPVDGGEPQRLTFNGTYNVSPRYAVDGKKLAYVQRNGGLFRVVIQDLDSGQVQVLTDTALDESPSFAPNGKTIIYATQIKGRGVLATVSSDGRIKQRFSTQAGEVREPAWGPLQ